MYKLTSRKTAKKGFILESVDESVDETEEILEDDKEYDYIQPIV